MAEGGDRKMVSERRPERRRSLRDVEMWRRAVAKCAPLSTALFGVGPKWLQIRSYFCSTAALEGSQGFSVGTDIGTDGPDAGASMARPRGLPRSSEVRVGCPPLGRAERTFWVRLRPYGWISSFFTAVFCSTQLASSIAVPGVPLDPQEELMVTRETTDLTHFGALDLRSFHRLEPSSIHIQ